MSFSPACLDLAVETQSQVVKRMSGGVEEQGLRIGIAGSVMGEPGLIRNWD